MPVIEGANMTSVSTSVEPLPEGDYGLLITTSEFSEDKSKIILKLKVEDPAEIGGEKVQGREFWEWCTVSGEWAQIGLSQIKRYLEAVFGKGSPEAEANPPDTDVLHGHRVRAYLVIDSYKDKTSGEERRNNKAKRIRKA